MDIATLNSNYQQHKAQWDDSLRLRIHRSLSWLSQASENQDEDLRFISLWIAFNAAYARDLASDMRAPDKTSFQEFLSKICNLDKTETIYKLLWKTFAQSIRCLLDNQFTFQPFWDYHNNLISENAWKEDFEQSKKKILRALQEQDTHSILLVLFERLYTLRNQIVHGGATFNSRVNRQQVQDANRILLALLPIILSTMMNNHGQINWGKPFYPVIK